MCAYDSGFRRDDAFKMSEGATTISARGHTVPVFAVCLVILAIWYLAAIPMNWVVTEPRIAAAGGGLYNTLALSWNHERPVIPAPHQVAVELWNSVFLVAP
jgi:NitT/TauT family transport system permease protein